MTGFGLIRQDLVRLAPFQLLENVRSENRSAWNRGVSPKIHLQWMMERGLALDAMAQQKLRDWYANGIVGRFPSHHDLLERYWLQVAKEGDPMGCELIKTEMAKHKYIAVRQACLSIHH